jgi:hypothetical protein
MPPFMLEQSLWTKINYGQDIVSVQNILTSVVKAVYARLIAMNRKSLREASVGRGASKTGEMSEKGRLAETPFFLIYVIR